MEAESQALRAVRCGSTRSPRGCRCRGTDREGARGLDRPVICWGEVNRMSRWLALGAGVVLLSALPRTLQAPLTTPSRIAVVAPTEPGSWLLGARLGMEEARRTARHLRRELHVVEIVPGTRAAAAAVHEAQAGTVVLVAGGDDDGWEALEATAVEHDLVLLDARPRHSRDAPCLPGVFRVGLPEGPLDGNDVPLLWHQTVSAEGAAELKERFSRRFGRAMDGAAWAGWFAVKVATAATLGVDAPEAGTIEGFLRSRAASFDGHKGEPLRFHSVERRLIQPTYAIGEDGAAAEVWWPSGGCTQSGEALRPR